MDSNRFAGLREPPDDDPSSSNAPESNPVSQQSTNPVTTPDPKIPPDDPGVHRPKVVVVAVVHAGNEIHTIESTMDLDNAFNTDTEVIDDELLETIILMAETSVLKKQFFLSAFQQ
jgi:hypothetical protein